MSAEQGNKLDEDMRLEVNELKKQGRRRIFASVTCLKLKKPHPPLDIILNNPNNTIHEDMDT